MKDAYGRSSGRKGGMTMFRWGLYMLPSVHASVPHTTSTEGSGATTSEQQEKTPEPERVRAKSPQDDVLGPQGHIVILPLVATGLG